MRTMLFDKLISRFTHDSRGTVAILGAFLFSVVLGAAALAVDFGSLYHERRRVQGAADLAAIAAAADLDHAVAAARATLLANDVNPQNLSVDLGYYQPDASIPYERRFVSGQAPFNSARVTVTAAGKTFFARTFTQAPVDIGATAVAANTSQAAFSIGSRLLAVRGGILNAVLGQMLGSNVSLSVIDYNQLLSANIKLFGFLNNLATQINVQGVSYNQLLNSSVTVGDVLSAAATTAGQNGDPATMTVLTRFLGRSAMNRIVPLSSVFDLGPLGSLQTGDTAVSAYDVAFNVMDLITGTAALANGKSQVAVDLGATIPGLLDVTLDIAIGEPAQHSAWVSVGQEGSTVSTTQTRIKLVAKVGGTGALAGTTVRLPLYLDLAYAQGALAAVTCPANGSETATIATTPGIADLWIGDVNANDLADYSSMLPVLPAQIVSAPLLTAFAGAHVNIGNTSPTMLTFDQADIDAGTIKQADTRNIAASAVSTLLGNLSLQVHVAGLGLVLPSTVTQQVGSQLGAVAAPLDNVVYSTLTALGVHVGEADVRVLGIRCGSSAEVG